MIYFDTSYLIRLYIEDPGWETVRALAGSDEVASCWHGRPETVGALHRVFRDNRVDSARFARLVAQFQNDCIRGGFQWLPFGDEIVNRVESVYARLPATVFLRAADALHLACAAEHGFAEVHSNDARFLAAAPHFGIRGVNIIP